LWFTVVRLLVASRLRLVASWLVASWFLGLAYFLVFVGGKTPLWGVDWIPKNVYVVVKN